jgi:hypothetical protein
MRAGPDREEARQAVHQLGPKSLPLLLKWLRKDDHPTLKTRFYNLEEATDGWLMNHKILKRHGTSFPVDPKESYRTLGLQALEELGPDGRAAIPVLIQMLGEKDPKTGEMAIEAGSAWLILPRMAPDSVEPLIQALSSRDLYTQVLAAGALAKIGTNATAAIPTFEKWLHDDRLAIRVNACRVLGALGVDPHEFIPVVIADLPRTNIRGTNFDMLDYQLEILTRYKTNAKPVIPILLEMLTNAPDDKDPTNGWIRGDVMGALREIDPTAAAKAGIK